jgi:hypothetical protein
LIPSLSERNEIHEQRYRVRIDVGDARESAGAAHRTQGFAEAKACRRGYPDAGPYNRSALPGVVPVDDDEHGYSEPSIQHESVVAAYPHIEHQQSVRLNELSLLVDVLRGP